MKVNKILILVAFIAVFLLGLFLGLNFKSMQSGTGPIGVNPLSKSCQYNGKTYKSGEGFQEECNWCSCNNGKVGCTAMACE